MPGYISDDDLATLRSLIGPDTDDMTIALSYDRSGSIYAVAQEVISEQLNALLKNPAQMTIPGEYSENWSANISALQNKLKSIDLIVNSQGGGLGSSILTSAPLCRVRGRR